MSAETPRKDCSSVPMDVTPLIPQSYARTLPPNTAAGGVPLVSRVLKAIPQTRLIVGPPGCGKTSYAIRTIGGALRAGVPAHRIGYVAFTRAAMREARQRLVRHYGAALDDLPFVRTIHSLAFRLLGWTPARLMDGAAWDRFGRPYGYVFTRIADVVAADEPFCPPDRTPADQLRFVLHHGRCRRFTLEELIDRRPMPEVRPDAIRLFARRLEAFKAESDLHDFDDLLSCALTGGATPDVDLVVVDEAQDLSPVQIALVDRWFGACPERLIVGDDDQAVYGFNGADPDWLLDLSRRHPTEVLTQSHRVPRAAHALAERIIAGNARRVAKTYRPTAEQGEVATLSLDDAMDRVDGRAPTFVLARNRQYLYRCAKALRGARVPFVVEGGGAPSVLADPFVRPAVAAAARLARAGAEEPVDAADLQTLLRFVPVDDDLLRRGVKAEVDRARGRVRPAELGLERLAEAAARSGPVSVLMKIAADERAYLADLLGGRDALPEPQVVLTTIHGAKGREADVVVVLPDMTRRTWDRYGANAAGREAENRIFYVAVTRTKRTLILVRPTTKKAFRFPSVRREEGVL